MKKILFLLIAFHLSLTTAFAQPGWTKKATKSVFTLKTFTPDGSLIASSTGFYTGTNGEAVSSFTPFKGASRAIIIDASGKEYAVKGMMGANSVYDIAKFRVAASKTQPLSIAPSIASAGSNVWLLPYRQVKDLSHGTIRKAETFQTDYAYYTVAMKPQENAIGCPLLNEGGQVVGLLQPASSLDTLSYAVSARFADSLKITGFSLNDPTMRTTRIKLDMPEDQKEATLLIYMAASSADSVTYATLIDDFIQKFPNASDGYVYRAHLSSGSADYAAAEQDMLQALKMADSKDDVHFNYARLIYNKEVYRPEPAYPNWTLDKALSEIQLAYAITPQPTYRQLEANILFAQQKYEEASDLYLQLTQTNLRSADIFFSASRCKELLKDTTAMLALLDSAVNTFSKPYLKEAAPYIWARANARINARKFRDAVTDLNDYEQLMSTSVNANFYYIRHQTEVEGRLYQQAINDINRAIEMEPKETLYYAEKASLLIRVGLYDDAIVTAKEDIALAPDESDGYLFLGLAQCLKGNKAEGLKNLEKAKELGDTQADTLIQKYALK